MPGDLARVVTGEVAELEGAPERQLDRSRQHRQVEEQARLELGRLDLGIEVRARAAERAQRQPVQVFEELPFHAFQTLGLVPRTSATVSR